MEASDATGRTVRAALFVDFDNVYIGLKRNVDDEAAESFATDPLRWIRWLEQGVHAEEEPAGGSRKRTILARRCYLNPKSHHRYRPFFIRAAFKVVDCPTLTYGGKNSADIQMVMDVLDTLHHSTRFEEFILFSGDADFTPVMLRLRDHDRRTVVLTIGPTAEAYLAACERVITEDVFVEKGLGMSGERAPREPGGTEDGARVSDAVLAEIAGWVYEQASANGEVEATALPRIYQRCQEFKRESNWLGFYSLRRLTERIVALREELAIAEGDPWRVVMLPVSAPVETTAVNGHGDQPDAEEDLLSLRERIVRRVSEIVQGSVDPVAMSRAADLVRTELGEQVLESRWAGAGTFRALLDSVRSAPFRIVTAPNSPGYLCDPQRYDGEPELVFTDPLAGDPSLAALVRRVHQITGVPRLTTAEYRFLFQCISDELAAHPYHLNSTSKAVRDMCIERGQSMSRANITWVLRGIAYADHPFAQGVSANTPPALATSFHSNLGKLCAGAQLELTPDEELLLQRWILGDWAPEQIARAQAGASEAQTG